MELENTFTVPVGVSQAWQVLNDVERIGPCMPGATITSVDGDDFTGEVRVRVGPVSMKYTGNASFTERDEQAHRAVIVAKGKEARGSGTANATVTATLKEVDDGTEVRMVTDLAVTGRPAQFGRGVLADVSNKLVGQFATCLSEELGATQQAGGGDVPEATPEQSVATTAAPPSTPETEPTTGATPVGASVAPGGAATAAAQPAMAEVGAVQDAPIPASTPPSQEAAAAGRSAERPAGGPDYSSERRERTTPEEIDLFDVAGAPLAKRLAPAALVLLVLFVILRRRRR